MRDSLAQWISDADALRHLEHFRSREIPLSLAPLRSRAEDYYLSLVGELFDRMRNDYADTTDWATLGNALVQFAERDTVSLARAGIHAGAA
jgi:transcriptional regulator with GAF, ATPase, and Fis domain